MAEEEFDIVNPDDQVIGRNTRSVAHRLGLWHRGAHVLLFTQDDRLIVQQRSKTKSQSPLTLDCSVSEHVLAGETYHAAAQRGLDEELGLLNVPIHPRIKFRMNYGPNDNEVSVIFTGIADPATIRLDPQEIERIELYEVNELQQLMEQSPQKFSYWFSQIFLWLIKQPSALQIMKTEDNSPN